MNRVELVNSQVLNFLLICLEYLTLTYSDYNQVFPIIFFMLAMKSL